MSGNVPKNTLETLYDKLVVAFPNYKFNLVSEVPTIGIVYAGNPVGTIVMESEPVNEKNFMYAAVEVVDGSPSIKTMHRHQTEANINALIKANEIISTKNKPEGE